MFFRSYIRNQSKQSDAFGKTLTDLITPSGFI